MLRERDIRDLMNQYTISHEDAKTLLEEILYAKYWDTHVCTEDGSPAMLIDAHQFILMNEDGEHWKDDHEYWEKI